MEQDQQRPAFQPFSFGGVARFASTGWGRTWLVVALVALFCSGTFIWFLHRCIAPQVTEAISNLPKSSEIRNGALIWNGRGAERLAEGPWISITVEPIPGQRASTTSDFELKFQPGSVLFRSLLGYTELAYPRQWVILFNRDELGPRWGAWSPAIIALTGMLWGMVLIASWFCLAVLYSPLVRLLVFYSDREANTAGVIRMNLAAMLTPATFMSIAIILYSMQKLSLPGLMLALAFHFLLQAFYVFLSPFALPKIKDAPVKNPFKAKPVKEEAKKGRTYIEVE